MIKYNFIEELRDELYFLKDVELEKIIEDYESLIEEKLADNIAIDEVIKSLDYPQLIAKNYADELNIKISSMDKIFVNGKRVIKKKVKNLREISNEKTEKELTRQISYYKDLIKIIMFLIVLILKFFILILKFIVFNLYLLFLYVILLIFMLLIVYINFGEYQVIIISLSTIGLISYIVFSSCITMKVLQIKVKFRN